jgi:5-formyltetrahydrofolate cyclo-ligase
VTGAVGNGDFDDIRETLRRTARAQRARLADGARVEAAQAAAEHFERDVPYDQGDVIAVYWPIREEIDTKPLLLTLMDAGLTVCLPVVKGQDKPLAFRVWEPDAALYEAGFGTLAPGDFAPETLPDIVVIPLVGFDRTGTRLGYGRGYYDRTIAALEKKPLLVGYAFAIQELPDIPRADHDIPLDVLVTEDGVRRFDN